MNLKLIGRVKYKLRPIIYEVYREAENGKIWVILHPEAPVTEYCQEAYASLDVLKTVLVIQGKNWEFEEAEVSNGCEAEPGLQISH